MTTGVSKETTHRNYEMLRNIFKSMIIGSKTAKYLSLAYVAISLVLAYIHSDDITYCVALILGALLVGGYALKFLWLNKINTNTKTVGELLQQIKAYKKRTLKREKYEQFVMTFWILTLVPAYLDGKDLTVFLVLRILIMFYVFIVIGNFMFNNVKKQFEEMDDLAEHL